MSKNSPSTNEIWAEVQKAFFSPTKIEIGGRAKDVPRFQAHILMLADRAARGEVKAGKEQVLLLKHLEKADAKERCLTERPPELVANYKKYEAFQKMGNLLLGFSYVRAMPKIIDEYTASHGALRNPQTIVPHDLDLAAALPPLQKVLRKFHRAKAKGKPFEVGYKKPPQATRFPPGKSGNESGLAKQKDVWECFRESLNEKVFITTRHGIRIAATKIGATCAHFFSRAQQTGDNNAYRVISDLAKDLDERGMLTPPEPPRRGRTMPLTPELSQRLASVEKLCTAHLEKVLRGLFAKRYGPAPVIVDYEHAAALAAETAPANQPGVDR